MSRLVIYGATGATGRRVAGLAVAAGIAPVLVGRRRDALEALAATLTPAETRGDALEVRAATLGAEVPAATLGAEVPAATLGAEGASAPARGGAPEVRVAELEPAALDAAFADAAVVVSCAGPYTFFGPPVLDAAIRAGAHYVDCTGEPRWVQRIADEFEGRAIAAGVAAVPSLGLGIANDLAARVAAEGLGEITELSVGIRIIGMRPSLATVRSTVEIVGDGAPVAIDGRITWELPGRRTHRFGNGGGALFASPDAIVLARAFPRARIASYMQGPVPAPLIAGGLAGGGALWRLIPARRATRALLARAERRGLSDHAGGGRSTVTVEARGALGSGTAVADVDDVYEVTGQGAFAVARALMEGVAVRGLMPAGDVVGPAREVAPGLGVRLS